MLWKTKCEPRGHHGVDFSNGDLLVISEAFLSRKQPCTGLKQLTFPGNPSKGTRLAPARRFTETASLSRAVNQSQRVHSSEEPQFRGRAQRRTYTRALPLRPAHPTGGRGQLQCCLATASQRPGPVPSALVPDCSWYLPILRVPSQ